MNKKYIPILILFIVTILNIVILNFSHRYSKDKSQKLPLIKKKPFVASKPIPKTIPEKKIPELKNALTVIIDDIGMNLSRAIKIWEINDNITLSILPFLKDSVRVSKYAEENKLSVMLHMPMEPFRELKNYDHFLATFMSKERFIVILNQNLKSIPFYMGINNHMGSKLTSNKKYLTFFFNRIKDKKVFFIDSFSTKHSIAAKLALKYHILSGIRDIFIDNENNVNYILNQLRKAEKLAFKKGYAIAIGHPHKKTLEALKIFNKTKKITLIRAEYGLNKFKNYEAKHIKLKERSIYANSHY